ncbi:hypothetical protein MAPG_01529 [Magnaporthiopsis poae ATCC 64411]|uniref:Uncharacterized protein n=1 Tax=Magnaporthiopsis poae (strain ATCC 64411 / 73-15) TaxID=644358 RepID=A0A0C4DNY0_MAGP6|nr:hypothetical protein MAPG_01529 [Magnaporthiopsis poae ATCC 64411]
MPQQNSILALHRFGGGGEATNKREVGGAKKCFQISFSVLLCRIRIPRRWLSPTTLRSPKNRKSKNICCPGKEAQAQEIFKAQIREGYSAVIDRVMGTSQASKPRETVESRRLSGSIYTGALQRYRALAGLGRCILYKYSKSMQPLLLQSISCGHPLTDPSGGYNFYVKLYYSLEDLGKTFSGAPAINQL